MVLQVLSLKTDSSQGKDDLTNRGQERGERRNVGKRINMKKKRKREGKRKRNGRGRDWSDWKREMKRKRKRGRKIN